MLHVIDPSTAPELPGTGPLDTSTDGQFAYTLLPPVDAGSCAVMVETVAPDPDTPVARFILGGFTNAASARTWIDFHSAAKGFRAFPHTRLAQSLHRWAAATRSPLTDLDVSRICA